MKTHNELILVVEDNQSVRDGIVDILRMEDYRVIEACDGLEGFNLAKEHIPNLIISDILMPHLDGFQFIKEVRETPTTETIPFIFLSALTGKKDIVKGIDWGAEDYLTKPISPDELIQSIDSRLQQKRKCNERFDNLKRSIFYSLPHKFRTPLNSILGYSELLGYQADNLSAHEVKDYANNIYTSGNRILTAVKNYIFYTKLTLDLANNQELVNYRNSGLVNVDTIIGNTLGRIKDKSIKIEQNLNSFKYRIEGSHLERIIIELIDNAITFSYPNEAITISSTQTNEYLKLVVFNTGVGMTDKQITKVGAFMQFNKKQEEQQGLGLGLSMVSTIAKIYGGEMIISSNYKKDFTVEITLPINYLD